MLGCRDVGKGERVAARILAEGGTTDVVVLPFDAASRTSIQTFSRAYRQRFDRLDVVLEELKGAEHTGKEQGDGGDDE